MKFARVLMLQALATTAFLAFAATASATILTSPAGTTYTKPVRAEAVGGVQFSTTFGSIPGWKCNSSSFEFTPEAHGAASTVSGKITSLIFGVCGYSLTSPVAVPGTLEIHTEGGSSNGNGTVTWTGAKIVVHSTALGTCTFESGTFESSTTHFGVLTGSNNTGKTATIHVNAWLWSVCGAAKLFGTYVVNTPDYLAVD